MRMALRVASCPPPVPKATTCPPPRRAASCLSFGDMQSRIVKGRTLPALAQCSLELCSGSGVRLNLLCGKQLHAFSSQKELRNPDHHWRTDDQC